MADFTKKYFPNLLTISTVLLVVQASSAALDTQAPFFHKTFFTTAMSGNINSTYLGWQRDGSEQEMTYRLTCESSDGSNPINSKDDIKLQKKLYQMLAKDNFDKFKKMSKCKVCEALSFGVYSGGASGVYGAEFIPWDKTSHAVRESLGYLPLTIEKERLMPEGVSNPVKLSYGSDLMDDIYFDSDEFIAFNNNYGLRARKRWDSAGLLQPASMRRILFGLKNTLPVDPVTGMKVSLKIDDRFDSPSMEDIKNSSNAIPTGFFNVNGQNRIIPSAYRLYSQLSEKGVLASEQGYENILQLKAKTFLRSLRLRFHYGTVDESEILSNFNFGKSILALVVNEAKVIKKQTTNPAELQILQKLINEGQILLDPTKDFDAKGYNTSYLNLLFMVGGVNPQDKVLDSRKLADYFSQRLHRLGNLIERNAKLLSQVGSGYDSKTIDMKKIYFIKKYFGIFHDLSDNKMFLIQASMKHYATLKNLLATDANAFLAKFNASGNTLKANRNIAYKDYAEFQDFTMDDMQQALKDLHWMAMDEAGRQVELAGSSVQQLWFHKLYTSVMNTQFWSYNMFIDTIDFVGIYTANDFVVDEYDPQNPKNPPVRKTISYSQLTNNHLITEESMDANLLGSYLSNDVQLELGFEKPYIDRKAQLKSAGESTEWVEWIESQLVKFQKNLSKIKMIQMNDQLKKDSFAKLKCAKWRWKPTDLPKGETSLKLISERK